MLRAEFVFPVDCVSLVSFRFSSASGRCLVVSRVSFGNGMPSGLASRMVSLGWFRWPERQTRSSSVRIFSIIASVWSSWWSAESPLISGPMYPIRCGYQWRRSRLPTAQASPRSELRPSPAVCRGWEEFCVRDAGLYADNQPLLLRRAIRRLAPKELLIGEG